MHAHTHTLTASYTYRFASQKLYLINLQTKFH